MKRSLFNKPAWSKSQSFEKPDNKEEDLFRRSERTYTDLVAEKERRKAEKKAREQRERLEKKDEEASRVKRRKTSESDGWDGGKDGIESTSVTGVNEIRGNKIGQASQELESPVGTSPQRSRSDLKDLQPTRIKNATSTTIVDLDSQEDDADLKVLGVISAQSVPVEDGSDLAEDDDDDEQFRELKRKAREKARLKKLGLYQPSPTPEKNSLNRSPLSETYPTDGPSQSPPQPRTPDPVLNIFITCSIEGAKPLIVQRKLSQPLREVRKVYCQKQGFPPEVTETTFLVYKDIKLFDVTSCKGLGINVQADGTISDSSGAFSSMDQRIHLELMTPEIFEAYRQHKARHRSAELDEDDPLIQEGPEEMPEPEIKITLRSKGLEEVKLKVRASTSVNKIVSNFRMQRNIGDEKEVALLFDGDRLNPESTVGSNDLDDMDNIDVHIK